MPCTGPQVAGVQLKHQMLSRLTRRASLGQIEQLSKRRVLALCAHESIVEVGIVNHPGLSTYVETTGS